MLSFTELHSIHAVLRRTADTHSTHTKTSNYPSVLSTNLCGMFRKWFSRHFLASLLFEEEMCASTEKKNQQHLEKNQQQTVLVWYVRSGSGSNVFKKHIQKTAKTEDDCTT